MPTLSANNVILAIIAALLFGIAIGTVFGTLLCLVDCYRHIRTIVRK